MTLSLTQFYFYECAINANTGEGWCASEILLKAIACVTGTTVIVLGPQMLVSH
jgi:hypothetical protein